jgi:DNA-binding MarR family transcriptional regulator
MELKEKMLVEILSKKRKIGEVADILSVSRQSVSKWLAQYKYAEYLESLQRNHDQRRILSYTTRSLFIWRIK